MQSLYQMIGISKQAHYKRLASQKKQFEVKQAVIGAAREIRKDHKRMGCRKLYSLIKPEGIGRDKTESILLSNGFRVSRKRNYHRTTYSGTRWYENRISGLEITAINQLWVSDITYIPVSYNKYYYLTLIQDVYSRKITGWQLSNGMRTSQTVVPAYQQAMTSISGIYQKELIFHSDKGSQYSSREMDQLHSDYGVLPSMGGKAWENAHAESLNGVLKNEYIDFQGSDISLSQARKLIHNIVKKYNEQRPHGSLKKMKPVEFETYVKNLDSKHKPIFKINY